MSSGDERVCPECGKSFGRPNSRSDRQWKTQRFCGLSCAASFRNKMLRLTDQAYFDERYSVASNGCWEWLGTLSESGYGVACIGWKVERAHRLSFRLHHSDPGVFFVCHRCDNPKCVNPAHLFLGTVRDNAADMVHKQRSARGAKNARSKLTSDQVAEIRRSDLGADELAVRFGVVPRTIRNIRNGASW